MSNIILLNKIDSRKLQRIIDHHLNINFYFIDYELIDDYYIFESILSSNNYIYRLPRYAAKRKTNLYSIVAS